MAEPERGVRIAQVCLVTPGKPVRLGDDMAAVGTEQEVQWSLAALTRTAQVEGDPGGAELDRAHPAAGRRTVAASPHLGRAHRSGVCPKRARIIALFADPLVSGWPSN